MINRQKKISPQELARARSSSFVVDLRQQKKIRQFFWFKKN